MKGLETIMLIIIVGGLILLAIIFAIIFVFGAPDISSGVGTLSQRIADVFKALMGK
ncbi:MAG: hypothetical protein V1731_01925 [Candidatus Aenigmatarchaeota archaeon]